MAYTSIIFIAQLLQLVLASVGDVQPDFIECVDACVTKGGRPLGLLKLLFWTTQSDCDYLCQQTLTNKYERSGLPVQQYHGKWPFVRIYGIQEPASVFFSLANFWPHYRTFMQLRKMRNPRNMHMKPYYLSLALVGMNTWIWSAVFHLRDTFLTERLDYFSALLQMTYTGLIAATRLFRLDKPNKRLARYLLFTVGLSFYALHVFYMNFVHFNYRYNMLVGVYIGIAQTLLWISIGITTFKKTKEPADLIPAVFPILILLGLTFELNDFPPFMRFIDAHSLWHASTVFPTFLSYIWIKRDMLRASREVRYLNI